MERFVIVGASLSGLRAAEALRRNGFEGEVVIIGEERHAPYDRPPLSKAVLQGLLPVANTSLPRLHAVDADWRLGIKACGLDVEASLIETTAGSVRFDRLLIATGTRARPWKDDKQARYNGVHTLRTRDDAEAIRANIERTDGRVAILGGGFIGSEIASICRKVGREVTVLERGQVPVRRALGSIAGSAIAELHRGDGVDFRTGASVEALLDDGHGTFRSVRLDDGSEIEADMCVVALGAVRNVEWLEGSGLRIDERGVHTDAKCRVLRDDGEPHEAVFAAGDVTCWPSELFPGQPVAIEHWSNAVEQACTAAHNMVHGDAPRDHDYMPTFWSSQASVTIKSIGMPSRGENLQIVQGDPASGRFLAVYGRGDRLVGALSIDHGRYLQLWEKRIRAGDTFPVVDPFEPGRTPTVRKAGFEDNAQQRDAK